VGTGDEPFAPGIPLSNTVIHAAPGQGVQPSEPVAVTRDLPFPVQLHDAAELAVRRRVEVMGDGYTRHGQPEVDMPPAIHGIVEFLAAQAPF